MPTVRINSQTKNTDLAGQTPKALGLNLAWSKTDDKTIAELLTRYPTGKQRSALIPLLHLAQRRFGGWLSVDAMQLVAQTLDLPYIRVYEVASFYTMFNLKPVGQHHIQVCTNCSCLIRGSDKVMAALHEELGIGHGQTTPDGQFTVTEVECLGACVAAPMLQISEATGAMHYVTNLDAAKTKALVKGLKTGDYAALVDTPQASLDPITPTKYAG
jgi:NADH-quinone oxidoreductase subunit E